MQGNSVSQNDVDAFIAQPRPRYVPPNIRQQRIGSTCTLFSWLGPLMMIGGLAFSGPDIFGGGQWNAERAGFVIVGAAFTLAGALSGFFAWRYRIRNMRLLRHGVLAAAQIECVEETEEYVGREQQFRARFQLDADGRQWAAECYLDDEIAKRACLCANAKLPMRMLFDPDYPDRILWADSLITIDE